MGFFSFLFGGESIKEALKKGAVIIDVRTAAEFDNGKVPGSVNIPVDRISINAGRIKLMNKPVVVCCASGARSSQAKEILKKAGIKEVYNGGSWQSVLKQWNAL